MDGSDVVKDVEDRRDMVAPFLKPGEQLQVAIAASSRPALVLELALDAVWPFLKPQDRYLLVATDQRWFVLRSSKERLQGELSEQASLPRNIRVKTSWFTRVKGFDRRYSISPDYQLWALAANGALDAIEKGQPWNLETAATKFTAADNSRVVEALMPVITGVGKLVEKRPKFMRR